MKAYATNKLVDGVRKFTATDVAEAQGWLCLMVRIGLNLVMEFAGRSFSANMEFE